MSAPRDYVDYLKDMLEEARLAQEFIVGITFDDFVASREKQHAVQHSLALIGEAARSVPEPIRAKYAEIEWRKITGTRDRLIHGYSGVSLVTVWDTVTGNLPELQVQLEEILREIE